jgi:hypothetical protein
MIDFTLFCYRSNRELDVLNIGAFTKPYLPIIGMLLIIDYKDTAGRYSSATCKVIEVRDQIDRDNVQVYAVIERRYFFQRTSQIWEGLKNHVSKSRKDRRNGEV